MTTEEELIFAPKIDTSYGVYRGGTLKMEVEDYTFYFVLPRIGLVLLLTVTFLAAPLIVWRIWLSLGMLQGEGLTGAALELMILATFLTFWGLRKKSSHRLLEGGEPFHRTVSLKNGFSHAVPWLKEQWQVFKRLAPLEKETYIYFMLAAVPETLLLLFGSSPLLWESGVAHLITLTVPMGLIFGMAGLLKGLMFWYRTGTLKLPYLVLVAVYLNFAYESGGAILIR